MFQPAIYILTNTTRTVLYIGVTSNLEKRIREHRLKIHPNAFTAKYNCTDLAHFEYFQNMNDAIAREKELKKWRREKKHWLIEKNNPYWKNLWKGE